MGTKKNFVLDTNVILHDYNWLKNFQENDIYLPLVVLEELDKFKKGNEQINFNAREFVRELDGVKYYNDSIATSPSRVISGVRAFNQKIIAIQGGSDKGNDLSVMVPDLLSHVKILILNGATADKIEQAVLAAPDYDPDQLQIIKVKDLAQAVEAARKAAQPGDIVSLCPACPAFDQFKTFEYRGREFKRLVNAF